MARMRVESESCTSAILAMRLSDPPPDIAADQPEGHADRRLDGHGEHADGQRDARAVENGAEQIAALRVGAEEEARVAAVERRTAADRRRAHRSSQGRRGSAARSRGAANAASAMAASSIAASTAPRPIERESPSRAEGGAGALPAHCRASRLMRGSSQRLTMSASVLVTTNRRPTATR